MPGDLPIAVDVIHVSSDLFILRGVPVHIRSDNGSKFVAKAAREWIAAVGAKKRLASSPAAHERTATSKASMFGSETNCSMVRSSTHCGHPRSSSEVAPSLQRRLETIQSSNYNES